MKKRLLTILIFVLAIVPFTAQNVFATPGYFFNGGYASLTNIGASGIVETQNPTITAGGSSSAWVMTANSSGQTMLNPVGLRTQDLQLQNIFAKLIAI